MRRQILHWLGAVLLLGVFSPVFSQYTFFTPEESFAIEVSLENTDLKRLPIYRNAITSLAVVEDFVVGGTSANEGMSPFLFVASLKAQEVVTIQDLSEVVPGQQSIRSRFVKGSEGQLFVGTMPQPQNDGSGHIIVVRTDASGNLTVADLGSPIAGEGVYALTANPARSILYGITFPSGQFFSFDTNTRTTKIYNELVPQPEVVHSLEEQYALTPDDFLGRALVTDNEGLVYGSLPFGKLFHFDPIKEELKEIAAELPEVWGRRSLAQVDSWLKTKEGKLYGGNRADGQLFELNPQTKQIKNLGKPIMMPGLPGLAQGGDGKIYGIAGGAPGYSHLFSYDPAEGFKDYGNPQFVMTAPGIEQGIKWRGFQLSTIAASADGTYIVMGEGEALSQLLVFRVP